MYCEVATIICYNLSMTVGQRIGAIRHKLGLNQSGLAERLGVHEASLRRWEKGQASPKPTMLAALADLGGVSVDWLLGRESPDIDLANVIDRMRLQLDTLAEGRYQTGTVTPDDCVLVPILGVVSAGPGTVNEQAIEGEIMVPRADIPTGGDVFFARVKGESMTGWGITEGDLVFVARGLRPENGDLVVAVVNSEVYLKRIQKVDGQVLLVSDAPTIEITPADEAQIIGPVLWARRYFRK